jgi:hypothetical protein
MPISALQDAEAQHLLQDDPNHGYEMTTMSGEPSTMGESSLSTKCPDLDAKGSEDSGSQENLLMGVVDAATLTVDPVYEAKARVLNNAVPTYIFRAHVTTQLTKFRYRRLVWAGTNGSCLSSSASAGQTIISGQLSPPSSVRTYSPMHLVHDADMHSDTHRERIQAISPATSISSPKHWSSGWGNVLGIRM